MRSPPPHLTSHLPLWMWEEVVQAVCSPLWAPLVVAELLCIIVFFFFCLFTRLEARPAPELIGLWGRVNSRAHTSLTASSRPKDRQGRQGRRGYCKSFPSQKDHPRKYWVQTAGLPLCGVQASSPASTWKEHLWFIHVFSCLCCEEKGGKYKHSSTWNCIVFKSN